MTDFLIGCDPEVFVTKNGVPISAQGLVEGTKKDPRQVSHGAVQVDGMALEFNTDPRVLTQNQIGTLFSQTVDIVLSQMKTLAQKRDPNIEFNIVPVMDFDADYLEAQPDEAKELGCDPDFNAYTGLQNETPDGKVSFRTAAGHIHIGWDKDIPVEHPDHF